MSPTVYLLTTKQWSDPRSVCAVLPIPCHSWSSQDSPIGSGIRLKKHGFDVCLHVSSELWLLSLLVSCLTPLLPPFLEAISDLTWMDWYMMQPMLSPIQSCQIIIFFKIFYRSTFCPHSRLLPCPLTGWGLDSMSLVCLESWLYGCFTVVWLCVWVLWTGYRFSGV